MRSQVVGVFYPLLLVAIGCSAEPLINVADYVPKVDHEDLEDRYDRLLNEHQKTLREHEHSDIAKAEREIESLTLQLEEKDEAIAAANTQKEHWKRRAFKAGKELGELQMATSGVDLIGQADTLAKLAKSDTKTTRKGPLEITFVKSQRLDAEAGHRKLSYKVTILNHSSRDVVCDGFVQWVTADGFEVDNSRFYDLQVGASSSATHTGTAYLTDSDDRRVYKTQAAILSFQ